EGMSRRDLGTKSTFAESIRDWCARYSRALVAFFSHLVSLRIILFFWIQLQALQISLQHRCPLFTETGLVRFVNGHFVMAVEEEGRTLGVAFQAILGDPTQDCFVDGDLSRLTAVVEPDLLLKQFVQNGRLALGAFGSALRIAACPRLDLMSLGRSSVADVVVGGSGPVTILDRGFWLRPSSQFFLPRLMEERRAATSSKVWPVAFRIASRLVKSCQRRIAAST